MMLAERLTGSSRKSVTSSQLVHGLREAACQGEDGKESQSKEKNGSSSENITTPSEDD